MKNINDLVSKVAASNERDLIKRALDKTNGNVGKAARLLAVSKKDLQKKMKELGIQHP